MPPGEPERPSLRAVQESFLAGLRDGGDGGAGDESGAGVFLEPPRGSAADRWRVYREAYVLRLVEAVGNDHPATARILGPAAFDRLVRRYLAAHPPASHDICHAARHLPGWLPGDPLTESLPFLPDLARFEQALAAAVVAADPIAFTREELAALDPDALFDAPLALASGAAFLASEWPLGDLWETRDQPDDEVALEVADRPSRLVVFRDGLAVRWRPVEDDDEAALLAGAARGETLAGLLDSGAFGTPEEGAPRLAPLFLRMVESSILRVSLQGENL
jgi:hypothetical protein